MPARPTARLLPSVLVRVRRRRADRHPRIEAPRLARVPDEAPAAHAAVHGPPPVPDRVLIRQVVIAERLQRPRFRALRWRRRGRRVREWCLFRRFVRDGVEERPNNIFRIRRPHPVRHREPLRLHAPILVRVWGGSRPRACPRRRRDRVPA